MRCWVYLWVIAGVGSLALAQDQPQGDQLKKMYDETLVQLKAAQERKTELAAENEKLNSKLADLQKQLGAVRAENQALRRDLAESSDKTFLLRSHLAAWESFVKKYPEIQSQWKVFSELDLFGAPGWLVGER